MAVATSTVCSSRDARAAAQDSACLPAGFSCALAGAVTALCRDYPALKT